MHKLKLIVLLSFFQLLNCNGSHHLSKRYLLFPRATVLQFTYGLSVPAIFPKRAINLSLCLQVNYELPFNLTNFIPRIVQAKASNDIDFTDFSREVFYKYIISFFDSFGLNGEQCLLRSICEISEVPMHLEQKENLLEEMVHFIFTPSLEITKDNTTESFTKRLLNAESVGQTKAGGCSEEYPTCLVSIVNLFTSKFII